MHETLREAGLRHIRGEEKPSYDDCFLFPYLVAEQDGTILGYAYAGAFKPREAYALSAELFVYVDGTRRGKGVGRALFAALEDKLASMDVTNLYACVAYPRVEDEFLTYASVCFHERMGFQIVGRFHGCDRKFDRLYDMVWMEKLIGTSS